MNKVIAMQRLCAYWLVGGLLSMGVMAADVPAPMTPRLTGERVANELDDFGRALSDRAGATHDDSLTRAYDDLARLAQHLRKELGSKAGDPVETLGDDLRHQVSRAAAASQRVHDYLDSSSGCPGVDARAMAAGLAGAIARLADAPDSSRTMQPVVQSVEAADHRPLFALRTGTSPLAFALVGSDLADLQCADPAITATDAQGKPLDAQPMLAGVSPARIELKLPNGVGAYTGAYVLHVVPKRKVMLRGCVAQNEAQVVLQVVAPSHVSVSYQLSATCNGHSVPMDAGSMPDLGASGATVSRQVNTAACAQPSRYTVSATAVLGDGRSQAAGPVEQSADASSIVLGLPDGLTLSWMPAARTLYLRTTPAMCKGVY